jgi:hypothetical protein
MSDTPSWIKRGKIAWHHKGLFRIVIRDLWTDEGDNWWVDFITTSNCDDTFKEHKDAMQKGSQDPFALFAQAHYLKALVECVSLTRFLGSFTETPPAEMPGTYVPKQIGPKLAFQNITVPVPAEVADAVPEVTSRVSAPKKTPKKRVSKAS